MNRLERCFRNLKQQQRKALTTFIAAGDPEPSITVPSMHQLVNGGADVLELSIPFSDPEADGPVIQAASERALKNGITLMEVLHMVHAFRRDNEMTPVVLMGYLNSVERMGYENFVERAAHAGVDGLIMVNLPPEESAELVTRMQAQDMAVIFLVAPTTSAERMDLIASCASGFIYYVSLKGTTGAGHLNPAEVASKVRDLRGHTKLPIQVGFGIKDGASARSVAAVADGVVVGSALVETMAAGASNLSLIPERLYHQVHDIRQAMDEIQR